MSKSEMIKWLQNLKEDIGQTQHQDLWHYEEMLDKVISTIEVSEEDELKFYYVESIDDYWIGQRLDNFYYAKWNGKLGFVWSASRYLPWGEHVIAEDTLWKEHTYPSEPREIPFTEWIVGFMKKRGVIPQPKEGEWVVDDLIRKSDVLETYAELYDIFDDNKAIQEELHKVFDKINDIPTVEPNSSEKPNNSND